MMDNISIIIINNKYLLTLNKTFFVQTRRIRGSTDELRQMNFGWWRGWSAIRRTRRRSAAIGGFRLSSQNLRTVVPIRVNVGVN